VQLTRIEERVVHVQMTNDGITSYSHPWFCQPTAQMLLLPQINPLVPPAYVSCATLMRLKVSDVLTAAATLLPRSIPLRACVFWRSVQILKMINLGPGQLVRHVLFARPSVLQSCNTPPYCSWGAEHCCKSAYRIGMSAI